MFWPFVNSYPTVRFIDTELKQVVLNFSILVRGKFLDQEKIA